MMRRVTLLAALGIVIGCLDDQTDPLGPPPIQSLLPQELVVSDPLSPRSTVAGSALRTAHAGTASTVTYVSLAPGTVPDGGLATIRNSNTGSQVLAALSDGGFDPVAIGASDGDGINVDVERIGGGVVSFQMTVMLRRRPVVVRTDPPPKKRDVPLNSIVHVVFSEPVVATSLAGIRLVRDGAAVSGHVTTSVDGLSADFKSDAVLAANADYALIIPTAVTDATGDHLEAQFVATFRTGTQVIAASIATAEPALLLNPFTNTLRTFTMSALRWGDGSVTGTFSIFYADRGFREFGQVRCFNIGGGDSAWVAGVIDAATDTSGIGVELAWRAVDNGPAGEAAPDLLTLAQSPADDSLTAQQFCDSMPTTNQDNGYNPFNPLLSGDIVVNSSGGPPPPPPPMSEIAFAAWPNGGIQVINADGTGGRVLTTNPDWHPAWSPDGRKIAFHRVTAVGVEANLYVMNADGSGLRQLTNDPGYEGDAAWSPDGNRIAFHHRGSIYVMSAVDGSGRIALTSAGCDFQPTWSPDGSHIAFTSCRAGTQSIFVMKSDGTGVTRITNDTENDWWPAWSPDGTEIVYQRADCCDNPAIYKVQPSGAGVAEVAILGRTPSWSPDSRAVVFEMFGLHSVGADGMGDAALGTGYDPAWSPLGRVPPRPPLAASVSITPTSDTIAVGDTVLFEAVVRNAAGNVLPNRTVAWMIDDSAHAAVAIDPPRYSQDWRVTGLASGSATVIALIDGKTDTAEIVVAPETLTVTAVVAGGQHTCAITNRQRPYCWGANNNGQVGKGAVGGSSATPVAVLGGLTFANLVAGDQHTCGLVSSGAAYCWGSNGFGQGGHENDAYDPAPTPVSGQLAFASLAAGGGHTCGVTSVGAAYCWGWNDFGQLGNGSRTSGGTPLEVADTLRFDTLVAGLYHTCGLTQAGAAYCWGDNGWGQLGRDSVTVSARPMAVSGELTFVALAAGAVHTCGLTAAGAAYCWGSNSFGQLGDGSTLSRSTPIAVSGGWTFTALVAGNIHTCGITSGGDAYCWGGNSDGQLGDGSTANKLSPVAVSGGLRFGTLTTQYRHTCGLTTSGVAYCWGKNTSGQVGDGSTTNRTVPVKIAGQP